MESVRARKSCSPTNWLDATNLVPGSSALASLHTDVYTAESRARFSRIGKPWSSGWLENAHGSRFVLESFYILIPPSLSLLPSVVLRPHSPGTFYAPWYTFTYVRNVCKWRTWGNSHRGTLFARASTELLKILLLLSSGRGDTWLLREDGRKRKKFETSCTCKRVVEVRSNSASATF